MSMNSVVVVTGVVVVVGRAVVVVRGTVVVVRGRVVVERGTVVVVRGRVVVVRGRVVVVRGIVVDVGGAHEVVVRGGAVVDGAHVVVVGTLVVVVEVVVGVVPHPPSANTSHPPDHSAPATAVTSIVSTPRPMIGGVCRIGRRTRACAGSPGVVRKVMHSLLIPMSRVDRVARGRGSSQFRHVLSAVALMSRFWPTNVRT